MKTVNYFWIYYAISFIYCVYKLNKSDNKRSLDGITGQTPGFNFILSFLLCYFLMPADLLVTLINKIKREIKKRETNLI